MLLEFAYDSDLLLISLQVYWADWHQGVTGHSVWSWALSYCNGPN